MDALLGIGSPGFRRGVEDAWQAWRTLRARRISPFDRRTRDSVAASSIFTDSSVMTWSTRRRISGSLRGEKRNLVQRERRAGESLWV